MKFRFSIASRISLAFGIIIIAVLMNAFILQRAFEKYQQENQQVAEVYSPSTGKLNELYRLINESSLISEVCLLSASPDGESLNTLKNLLQQQLPSQLSVVEPLAERWDSINLGNYREIQKSLKDSLLPRLGLVLKIAGIGAEVSTGEQIKEINTLSEHTLIKLMKIIEREEEEVQRAHQRMEEAYNQFHWSMGFMTILLVLIALVIGAITTGALVRPIRSIRSILNRMSQGILPREKVRENHDEIGDMAVALNSLIKSLREISEFSVEIGKGNFGINFKPLSEEDVLGNALINMRDELRKAAEEENKRKKEDDERNWATHGLAKFGEILRQSSNNIEELSYNIISNLVDYTGSNQGGLFLINNSDPDHHFLELISSYAFNRKKYLEKQIDFGEGLVGRCVQERATIYLTDIPEDYIRINSGLGDANPRSLLIVPLMVNEEIFGVIEMASFEEFEKYKIQFVEKIGESIASTISTVKFNIQTASLLDQSRLQAEQMASQEEEMRQNMEELRATQEQSERREQDLIMQLEELRTKYNDLIARQ